MTTLALHIALKAAPGIAGLFAERSSTSLVHVRPPTPAAEGRNEQIRPPTSTNGVRSGGLRLPKIPLCRGIARSARRVRPEENRLKSWFIRLKRMLRVLGKSTCSLDYSRCRTAKIDNGATPPIRGVAITLYGVLTPKSRRGPPCVGCRLWYDSQAEG